MINYSWNDRMFGVGCTQFNERNEWVSNYIIIVGFIFSFGAVKMTRSLFEIWEYQKCWRIFQKWLMLGIRQRTEVMWIQVVPECIRCWYLEFHFSCMKWLTKVDRFLCSDWWTFRAKIPTNLHKIDICGKSHLVWIN